MTQTFSNLENTKVTNSFHGWKGETKVKVGGKNWVLSTLKRYNGTISTHCQAVEDEGDGNYSFMMFGQDKKESFYLNELPKGTKATEKAIREAHFKSLALFDAKQENKELPDVKEEYRVEVGQIIFGNNPCDGSQNKRVVYEIDQERRHYKTVLLDGSRTKIDMYLKNWSNKFGIGTYYKEGEILAQDEINELLISANENMKQEAARQEAQSIINEAQGKAKREYLSQFIKADRRTTTNIIKRHILKTWNTVSKVEVKTDVFAGGDSMDVTYSAPTKIEELESFIKDFQYGRFNGMEDIYEHNKDQQEIILEGHILEDYKYVSCYFKEVAAPEPTTPTFENVEVKEVNVQIVDYSEKAIAVIGDTKPLKDILKELGGRFNFRLSCGAGWIFPKTKLQAITAALNLNQ